MDENALIGILQNIEKRLISIEKSFIELSKRAGHNSFHLDVMNVQTLNLDELSYRLDNIDVKELSGTLNIGNTFPPHMRQFQAGGKEDKEATNQFSPNLSRKSQSHGAKRKKEKTSNILVKINGKGVPYRLINKQKTSQPDKALTSTFTIGDISIGTIEDASAVNFGNNFPTDFKSHKKLKQGFGNILGNQNDIHDILSQLEEKDVVEVYNESQDHQSPEWLETIVEEQKKEVNEATRSDEEDKL